MFGLLQPRLNKAHTCNFLQLNFDRLRFPAAQQAPFYTNCLLVGQGTMRLCGELDIFEPHLLRQCPARSFFNLRSSRLRTLRDFTHTVQRFFSRVKTATAG